jgi:hypothetical protein
MLELTIHESFPLSDDNKYIDVVASVARQWGESLVCPSPSTFSIPSMIEFEFYCVNKCDHPYEISADAHKRVVGALVAAGVLQSVRWKHVGGFIDTFHIDVKDPRVVVRIE